MKMNNMMDFTRTKLPNIEDTFSFCFTLCRRRNMKLCIYDCIYDFICSQTRMDLLCMHAKTLPKYIKKHPQKARIQFMPIRLNFIKNWRILARQPLYCVGMFFMKMLEYAITGNSYDFDNCATKKWEK